MGNRGRSGATFESSQPHLILNIFDGEAALLGRMARRGLSGNLLLLFPLLCLILVAVAAASTNAFSQPNLGSLLCHDLGIYIGAHWGCIQTADSTGISLLRDVPTLTAIVFVSLTPWLMYRQWTGIKTFLHKMESNKLLSFPKGRHAVVKRIQKCNHFFRSASGTNPLTMLAAVTFILLISEAQQRFGVYTVLVQQQPSISPFGWWASLSRYPTSWLLYVLIGSVGVYTILLQNIYGGRTVLLVWQLRNEVWYLADPDNLDGNYGWSEINQILWPTWVALMVHGIALILVALSLSRIPALYLLPLLGQWVVAAPLYVGIPVYLIRKSIRRFKMEEQNRLRNEHQQTQDLAQKSVIADRLERVRAVKVIPFARSGGVALIIIGLLSSVVTIGQLAWLIYF
jgi:hypothetical protein